MTKQLAILATSFALLIAGCDKIPGMKPAAPTPLDSIDAPKESKDYLKSRATHAAGLKRNALIHFSLEGCGPCRRLDEDVLAKQEWRDFAKANLLETIIEFPSTITSEDTDLVMKMQAMEGIATKLNKNAAFPFLVVLGRDGSILGGRSGYVAGGASGYVQWAQALLAADTSPAGVPAASSAEPASKTPARTNKSDAAAKQEPTPAKSADAKPPETKAAPPTTPVVTATPAATSKPATNAPALTPCDYVKVTGLLGKGDRAMVFLQAGGETVNLKSGKEVEINSPGGKFNVRIQKAGADETVLLIVDIAGKEHVCTY